ncbi:hypothetical protein BW723_13635 [Polaribacter reichenbachii]|uniref:Uncharacterized protein n=1 Tax=Polaribacter reichenbachii TaxID=996801 RepID=A0A1B8U1L6_9FLAO|nr:hypothetical protein [Polaribacter reichenbachii]APZ47259.1 hypothetical protein BW723_13635 [Polaribacter reichenbachii]AUC17900.1 hypothetical protein BTO17_04090 [Polaribacter reichenbachii]OBY65777.1 hypothetical protein LPB301_08145 [Polaribacter reichenbachii]
MRNIVLAFGFILISAVTYAQKRSDFKGPAYKNYKYWKHNTAPTIIYVSNAKKGLQGPAYKNYKPSKDDSNTKSFRILNVKSKRKNLMGPAYKNYKIWKKNK